MLYRDRTNLTGRRGEFLQSGSTLSKSFHEALALLNQAIGLPFSALGPPLAVGPVGSRPPL